MANCSYCGQPCAGKYCPGNACKNRAWRLYRDLGHAFVEDGLMSLDEARIYLDVRDRARRACNAHREAEPLTVDMRGCFRKGAQGAREEG